MKKLLLILALVSVRIFVMAQYNGIQVTTNTSSFQTQFGHLDTVNFWYSGSSYYNSISGIATVRLTPRYGGYVLDGNGFIYPVPNQGGSFTVTWSAPTGISPASIVTQLKSWATGLGFTVTAF